MCVFCEIIKNQNYFYENDYFVAFYDNYPVSKGHTIIIPKRHFETYFEMNDDEVKWLNIAIFDLKDILDNEYHPTSYNIGTNAGIDAGQTVMHFHMHLIPRYKGDMDDPRGGVRGVIPSKQKY